MSDRPELSVVMSVYNQAEVLERSLRSVLDQAGVDLEVIVVNDGSDDETGDVLNRLAAEDQRIRPFHQDNQGLTRSLIRGCAEARADWIARQDCGDLSLPGRFQRQLERGRQEHEFGMIACGSRGVLADGTSVQDIIPPENPREIRSRILQDGQAVCAHPALMFRKDVYEEAGGYREAFYYAQDIDLILRLAERTTCASVPAVLYEFEVNPESISGTMIHWQKKFYGFALQCRDLRGQGRGEETALNEAEELSRRLRDDPASCARPFDGWYFHGCRIIQSDPVQAQKALAKAIACNPFSLKAWCRWLQAGWARLRKGCGQ